MDGLSATASVVAVIQLSSKVVGYINAAAGAREQRKRLRDELLACDDVLQQLRDNVDQSDEGKSWARKIEALDAPGAPLGRLSVALDALAKKLEPKSGSRKVAEILKWPFQEKEVEKIIASIEREKTTLDMALTNEYGKLIQKISQTSKENREKLTELIDTVKKWDRHRQAQSDDLKDSVNRFHVRQDIRDADQKHKAILTWLSQLDYDTQQNDFYSRRQPGTCQWLLDSNEYQEWLNADQQAFFCPGIPGSGKTILASIVIQDLKDRYCHDMSTTGIAYIFFNFRRKDEQELKILFASLTKQLLRNLPALPRYLKDFYDCYRQTSPPLYKIIDIFKALIAQLRKAFIVIDALDECSTSGDCLPRFFSVLSSLQQPNKLNILATSRHIPTIKLLHRWTMTLEIRAHDDDVRKYLEGRMFVSGSKLLKELEDEIETHIVGAVDGMFLLAQLYFDSIKSKKTPKKVKVALKALQKASRNSMGESAAYHDAYDEAMKRIGEQDEDSQELAKHVLSWITHAARPLSTTELQHALAIEVGEPEFDPENLPEVDDMVSACAGLVTVDKESGIIRLVHHTTQEYFERTRAKWFPDSQASITKACITYLSYPVFEAGCAQAIEELEQGLKSNPLYQYAACYWGDHARNLPSCEDFLPFLQSQAPLEASAQVLVRQRLRQTFGFNNTKMATNMTGLHLAAYFGLAQAVNSLTTKDLNAKDDSSSTPLSWAVVKGHDTVVKLLLATEGIELEARDKWGQTPFYWAAVQGHEAILKLLLAEQAIDFNIRGSHGRTPICLATKNGDEAIFKLLLATEGVDLNIKDDSGRAPLSWAVERGDDAIVKLLLAADGIALNTKDNFGQTPLYLATRGGRETIIELLLATGKIDPNIKDNAGQTPLSLAVDGGHKRVVKLLLSAKRIDLNMNYEFGRTPLCSATKAGHEAIVQMLLATKRNDPARDDSHSQNPLSLAVSMGHSAIVKQLLSAGYSATGNQTLLLQAARNGHDAIVELLLATKGVDSNVQGCENKTPLSLAAERGNEAIVKQLLAAGVNSNVRDWNGQTPIALAAGGRFGGHRSIVQLLLNANVASDVKDCRGQTPLLLAAKRGHADIIQLLLAAGADPNVKDQEGQTPLLLAAERGYTIIIKLLQAAGVDPNTADLQGQTPLLRAARDGHEDVVRLLLATEGVNPSVGDNTGQTPLLVAAGKGRTYVVQMLLDAKVDPKVGDLEGRTPLLFAAAGGHEAVARLLLAAGADSNVTDNEGRTPLSLAKAGPFERHKAVVQLLLDSGCANPSSDDEHENTSLEFVEWRTQLDFPFMHKSFPSRIFI